MNNMMRKKTVQPHEKVKFHESDKMPNKFKTVRTKYQNKLRRTKCQMPNKKVWTNCQQSIWYFVCTSNKDHNGYTYENYHDDDDVGEDIDDVDDDDDVGDEIDDVDDDDDGRAGGNQELAARPSAKKPFSTILSFLLRAIHTLPSISSILKIMVLQLKLMRYLIRFFDKKSLEIVLGDLRDKLMRTSVGAEFCPFQRK